MKPVPFIRRPLVAKMLANLVRIEAGADKPTKAHATAAEKRLRQIVRP